MSTLTSPIVSKHLEKLFADAQARDQPVREQLQKLSRDERNALEHDHRRLYGVLAREAYLPVTPQFGQLLYVLARSPKAKTIVEFGTSFGISTIHLAAALRDIGGGVVIATEYEPVEGRAGSQEPGGGRIGRPGRPARRRCLEDSARGQRNRD
jgi:predicted O-methyltransferase YrrM